MAYFVVAGKPDCPQFVHAAFVSNYLKERLPNFNLRVVQKKVGDWEPWLEKTNLKHGWHHTKSPIIWKTLTMRKGNPYLIGGLSEFWEYCYDYYNLESLLSKEDLEKLVADNIEWFEKTENIQKEIRNICIFGATNPINTILLPELLKIPELELSSGLTIRLFDDNFDDRKKYQYLRNLCNELKELATIGHCASVHMEDMLTNAVTDCDLLIVTEDLSQMLAFIAKKNCRKVDEDEDDFYIRNMCTMYHLADVINAFAPKELRIVLAHPGSISITGTLLAEACTKIRLRNIVGVSSDVGLCALNVISNKLNIPLASMGGPPVWGFMGKFEFVDVEYIIQKCDVYKPYLRAIKTNGGSTLPLGTIQSELRRLAYLIDKPDDIQNEIDRHREYMTEILQKPFCMAKVRATISLLKLWYSKELPDEIISLAILSHGEFEIPEGCVFSQPVHMNEKRMWVPFTDFPASPRIKAAINKIKPHIQDIFDKFGVKRDTPSYILL